MTTAISPSKFEKPKSSVDVTPLGDGKYAAIASEGARRRITQEVDVYIDRQGNIESQTDYNMRVNGLREQFADKATLEGLQGSPVGGRGR